MLFTSPRIPNILRHNTEAESGCQPIRFPPAIILQSSARNSLLSEKDKIICFNYKMPKAVKRKELHIIGAQSVIYYILVRAVSKNHPPPTYSIYHRRQAS